MQSYIPRYITEDHSANEGYLSLRKWGEGVPLQKFIDTFDGAKPRFLNRGKKALFSINPEHTPGFRPGSRMVWFSGIFETLKEANTLLPMPGTEFFMPNFFNVMQWSRDNVNPQLNQTFAGIERYLSTEAILEANHENLLEVRRPAREEFPLSTSRQSIKKIDLANFIVSRDQVEDILFFRLQLR